MKDGKLGAPLKGATLIGTGPESMQRISMIGNDMALDEGIGTCGKAGQGVPVGVGQPTLRPGRTDGRRHGVKRKTYKISSIDDKSSSSWSPKAVSPNCRPSPSLSKTSKSSSGKP